MNFYFILEELNDTCPTAVNDQHTCVVFAQGLKTKNINYNGNINFLQYWKSDEYLINKLDIKDTNENTIYICAVPHKFSLEIQSIVKLGRKLIIFDTSDEWCKNNYIPFMKIANYYFKSSYSSNNNNNCKPYAFSLSDRIINVGKTTDMSMLPWQNRKNVILEAHRVTNHSIRNYVKSYYNSGKCNLSIEYFNDNFKEPSRDTEEYFHWCQTGRRHSLDYYEKLKSSKMIDSHGGYFRLNNNTKNLEIIQIDSWKLWEGFAMGCLVIAPDFDYYNIKLPYKLIGLKHYIPIRYDIINECYDIIHKLSDLQKYTIAKTGREFVLDKYCPNSISQYVLDNI